MSSRSFFSGDAECFAHGITDYVHEHHIGLFGTEESNSAKRQIFQLSVHVLKTSIKAQMAKCRCMFTPINVSDFRMINDGNVSLFEKYHYKSIYCLSLYGF